MPRMWRYVVNRLIQAVISLIVIATLVFVLFRAAPGDPTTYLVDPTFPQEVQDELRASFGLDKSVWEQYLRYLVNLFQADLGVSFFYGRPVWELISERLWNTLILAFAAFVVAYVLAFVVGGRAAARKGKAFDNVSTVVALFFRSAPSFWVGMLALIVFSFWLGWFPHAGMRSTGYEAAGFLEKVVSLDFLHHLVLPAVVSGLYFWGLPFLLVRNTTVDVLKEDFVELSRAKGVSERAILYRHAIRNSLLPVVTSAGAYVGMAAGGMVVIEVVFSWPGLGREIVTAVQRHDYTVAQGAFLLLAVMVLIMNLVVDLIYRYVDPRVRVGAGHGG